jgi:tetratricopeptide (TPR) repeat protein
MLQLWPPASDLPAATEADFCLALARLNESAGREEHWQAARRAETLYRQLGDADRLGDALLLIGTIGLNGNHVPEAERALHEAEKLVTDATALRKQAALAATQGECYGYLGEHERSIAAFRRQGDLYRQAGAELGEYLALGNVGSAQLEAGEMEAAIESLRTAVDGLRRINAPYGLDFRLSMLSIALALRGDAVEVLALAREAFDRLRGLGATSGPLLAAALHHARRDDLRRAVLLAGYALSGPKTNPAPACLHLFQHVQQQVCDRALIVESAATVESWRTAGEQLTEARAAAIAFDGVPLDGLS